MLNAVSEQRLVGKSNSQFGVEGILQDVTQVLQKVMQKDGTYCEEVCVNILQRNGVIIHPQPDKATHCGGRQRCGMSL